MNHPSNLEIEEAAMVRNWSDIMGILVLINLLFPKNNMCYTLPIR